MEKVLTKSILKIRIHKEVFKMLKTNPFASRNSKIRAVILKCNNQAAHGYILKMIK